MDYETAAATFGLSSASSVTPEELRKIYLRKALQLHPDRHITDKISNHEKFTKLQNAYAFLLEKIEVCNGLAEEKAQTEALLAIWLKALQGDNVDKELRDLGMYRPPKDFGIDLNIVFDGRIKNAIPQEELNRSFDIDELFEESFRDDGLDNDGNPLSGWAYAEASEEL